MRPTVEDELNAAWAEVNAARRERDRAIETRENANAVSIRVEAENNRLREALRFYSDGFAYLTPEGWKRIWNDGGKTAREALDA